MSHPARDWRRIALTVVVLGAMSVSIGGQVQAIEPQIGHSPAVVFALTNDAGSILALNIALSATTGSSVRKWAWVAILIAAGAGAALNSWHVVNGDSGAPLPALLAVMAGGVEPILLVLVLSHLIGLVVGKHQSPAGETVNTSDRQDAATSDHQETRLVIGTSTTSPVASAVTSDTTGPPAGDRQEIVVAAPPATTSRPSTPAPKAVPTPIRKAVTPPGRALTAVRSPRPAWATDTLLAAVVEDMRQARSRRESYGRDRLVEDRKLSDHRAKVLLAYIRDHRLLEAAS